MYVCVCVCVCVYIYVYILDVCILFIDSLLHYRVILMFWFSYIKVHNCLEKSNFKLNMYVCTSS